MLEDELLLAGHRRSEPGQHEVAVLQPGEDVGQLGRLAVQQAGDGPGPEDAAHDRGGLQRALVGGVEQVDPGRQHRLHAVGDLHALDIGGGSPARPLADDAARVDQMADDLLEIEGISLAALEDRPVHGVGQVVDRQEQSDEAIRIGPGERLERDAGGVPPPAAPRRTALPQLRPGGADDEDASLRPIGDLLEQIEERGIGPVDVLDDDHHGAAEREGGEEGAPRAVDRAANDPRLEIAKRDRGILDPHGVGERGGRSHRVGRDLLRQQRAPGAPDLGERRIRRIAVQHAARGP